MSSTASTEKNTRVSVGPGRLGREGLLAAIANGDVVCTPFDPDSISGAQIDVRLAYTDCWMIDEETSGYVELTYFGGTYIPINPWRGRGTDRFIQQSPRDASSLSDKERSYYGLKKGDRFFLLAPGAMGLFRTLESVGCGPNYTTSMHSRSTTVRNGLSVCRCGGLGDPGYINYWTMEIKNELQHSHIVLMCGERIAQITVDKLALVDGKLETEYARARGASDKEKAALDYRLRGGKYRATGKEWHPRDMLPRGFLDNSNDNNNDDDDDDDTEKRRKKNNN